jgi:hypothetical protein
MDDDDDNFWTTWIANTPERDKRYEATLPVLVGCGVIVMLFVLIVAALTVL